MKFFSLLAGYVTALAFLPSQAATLDEVLALYNGWKTAHPTVLFNMTTKSRQFELVVTNCIFENVTRSRTQMLEPVQYNMIQFLADGKVLDFFPVTNATVVEPSELKAYVFRDLGWNEPLTVEKVAHFGGELESTDRNGLPSLIIKVPTKPFAKETPAKPTYAFSLEFQLDKEGKILKQVTRVQNFSPLESTFDYVSFDSAKVKEAFGAMAPNTVVTNGLQYDDAVSNEIARNIAQSLVSP